MNVVLSLVIVVVLIAVGYVGGQAEASRAFFGVALPYAAFVLFAGGFVYKIVKWARAPVPFRIPTTCGQQKTLPWIKPSALDNPHTMAGVIGRMLLEVLFFRSLFRNTEMSIKEGPKVVYGPNKWLWLAGMVFHYSMLVILVRHLRLFVDPVPTLIVYLQDLDGFLQIGAPAIFITTFTFLAALAFLFARRVWSPQLRYISLVNDYFPLFVLLGIGLTGATLRHLDKTDIVAVKQLIMGLIAFNPAPPQANGWFYAHLTLVSTLFAYFPFSKLMHLGGVFMSPTRNLANNNRMIRHINPWNPEVSVHTYEEYEDDFRERMVEVGIPVEREA